MDSDNDREQQICKAWASEADHVDQLEALISKLVEACKYSLNLELYRVGQHTHAIALFEAVLSDARKAGIIK